MGSDDAGPLTYVLWEVLGPPWIGDLEVLGALARYFPVLTKLPGVEETDVLKLSLWKKLLWAIFVLVPYGLDSEVFKIFKVDLFQPEEQAELDPLYERGSGNIDRGKATDGGSVRSGARSRLNDYKPNTPDGHSIGKILVDIVMFVAILAVAGGIGAYFLGGTGYGDFLASEVGFQAAQLQVDVPLDWVAQAGKTIECAGNVACVRKWQFNNTQRPGSEEVGQEYSLEIENYEVNDGFPLDISNRQPDDRIPVDFSVYNPRHGLKGITARNVVYRVGVYDNTGSVTGEPECETGWKPLGGEYAGTDSDGKGKIMPGGFATPLGTHEQLNLANCGLLQPALGLNRIVKLQVKYDYSSQSTLQVEAMSRQNMLSLDERPSFKQSKTADTPVKTYINAESPITYRVDEDTGERQSSIFGVRLGFETGQKNLKYRVKVEEFEFYDSSKTVDVANADFSGDSACEDLKRVEEDLYTFSGEPEASSEDSEGMATYLYQRQQDNWFESGSGPSPARCSMILQNPDTISPTGETLTMRVDANYTVMLEKKVTGFEAMNSRCSSPEIECPMLVPKSKQSTGLAQLAESVDQSDLGQVADQAASEIDGGSQEEDGNQDEDGDQDGVGQSGQETSSKLISRCDSSKRVDANDGCGARLGENWVNVNEDYALNESVDKTIEEGETAYLWNEKISSLPGQSESLEQTIVGLKPEVLARLRPGSGDTGSQYAALVVEQTDRGADLAHENIDVLVCEQSDQSLFRELWKQNQEGEVLYINTGTTSCEGDTGTNYGGTTEGGAPQDTAESNSPYQQKKSECQQEYSEGEFVVVRDGSSLQCYS